MAAPTSRRPSLPSSNGELRKIYKRTAHDQSSRRFHAPARTRDFRRGSANHGISRPCELQVHSGATRPTSQCPRCPRAAQCLVRRAQLFSSGVFRRDSHRSRFGWLDTRREGGSPRACHCSVVAHARGRTVPAQMLAPVSFVAWDEGRDCRPVSAAASRAFLPARAPRGASVTLSPPPRFQVVTATVTCPSLPAGLSLRGASSGKSETTGPVKVPL